MIWTCIPWLRFTAVLRLIILLALHPLRGKLDGRCPSIRQLIHFLKNIRWDNIHLLYFRLLCLIYHLLNQGHMNHSLAIGKIIKEKMTRGITRHTEADYLPTEPRPHCSSDLDYTSPFASSPIKSPPYNSACDSDDSSYKSKFINFRIYRDFKPE